MAPAPASMHSCFRPCPGLAPAAPVRRAQRHSQLRRLRSRAGPGAPGEAQGAQPQPPVQAQAGSADAALSGLAGGLPDMVEVDRAWGPNSRRTRSRTIDTTLLQPLPPRAVPYTPFPPFASADSAPPLPGGAAAQPDAAASSPAAAQPQQQAAPAASSSHSADSPAGSGGAAQQRAQPAAHSGRAAEPAAVSGRPTASANCTFGGASPSRAVGLPARPPSGRGYGGTATRRGMLQGGLALVAGLGRGAAVDLAAPQAALADDFTLLPSGLRVLDVRPGSGEAPRAGDTCVVHWSGYTSGYQGKRIGNTSVSDEPYEFVLGAGQAIPAFEEAVAGMRAGGVRRMEVPGERPALAWPRDRGLRFTGEVLPSKLYKYRQGPQPAELGGQRALDFVLDNPTLRDFNRTLLFDIKLLAVRPGSGSRAT